MQAALVVLDGWGLGDHERLDAVRTAETPTMDSLTEQGANGTLETWGRAVGLPEGQMGNSEVGHLTIGAGRVIDQSYTRITRAVESGELRKNDAIESAFTHADEHDGRVHFMGLVSDGGVHSHEHHLHALIKAAAEYGVDAVTHVFTDGRDTPPKSATGYLTAIESVIEKCDTGDVATVSGRYYAMDRDENWKRTKRAYDAITEREADYTAETAVAAVESSYDRGDTDEFVEPTCIEGGPALADGDSVIFFNFRADRARQLVRMLTDSEARSDSDCSSGERSDPREDTQPEWEFETNPPEIRLVTMTEYDETFEFPVAFEPNEPEDTLGETLAVHGKTQLRIAESEKYPHVTYFLNGGREVEFEGEIREIVESPDVPTYDQQPEMSAEAVTDTAIEIIESEDPDVMVLNYANPDMVGHTGDFDAAVTAVEAVDTQLKRLVETCREAGGGVLVTADHGNADDMGTEADPDTAHTKNPVPVVYLTADGTDDGKRIRAGSELTDLAPTILGLCDIDVPEVMTGQSLLE